MHKTVETKLKPVSVSIKRMRAKCNKDCSPVAIH